MKLRGNRVVQVVARPMPISKIRMCVSDSVVWRDAQCVNTGKPEGRGACGDEKKQQKYNNQPPCARGEYAAYATTNRGRQRPLMSLHLPPQQPSQGDVGQLRELSEDVWRAGVDELEGVRGRPVEAARYQSKGSAGLSIGSALHDTHPNFCCSPN